MAVERTTQRGRLRLPSKTKAPRCSGAKVYPETEFLIVSVAGDFPR